VSKLVSRVKYLTNPTHVLRRKHSNSSHWRRKWVQRSWRRWT